jgi:hypothetical protein
MYPIIQPFQRLFAEPLDGTTRYTSLEALQLYASSNPTAYVGQICSTIIDDIVTQYQINSDMSVAPLQADRIFDTFAKLEAYTSGIFAKSGQICTVVEEGLTITYVINEDLSLSLASNYILADTLANRDLIPMSIRAVGLKCYVQANNNEYTLKYGIENINWERLVTNIKEYLELDVNILSETPLGTINKPHGSMMIDDKIYITERYDTDSRLVKFNNLDDLTDIDTFRLVRHADSFAYNSTTGYIYIYQNSESFYKIKATDFTDASLFTVLPNSIPIVTSPFFRLEPFSDIIGSSCPYGLITITDGTYLYGANYVSNADVKGKNFFKIHLVNRTYTWITLPALGWIHSGLISTDGLYGYFTNYANEQFYKIKLSDLTVEYIDISQFATTLSDDMAIYNVGGVDYVYTIGESGNPALCVINTATMTASGVDSIAAFGCTIYGDKLYTGLVSGAIQVYDLTNLNVVDTYTMTGWTPNEILFSSTGRMFVTDWGSTVNFLAQGRICECEANSADSPLVTKVQVEKMIHDNELSAVFTTYSDLETYALTNENAYKGQVLSLVNADSVIIYKVNSDLTVSKVGSGTVVVTELADRDLIPSSERYIGFEVYVINDGVDGKKYRLVNDITNTDWITVEFTFDSVVYEALPFRNNQLDSVVNTISESATDIIAYPHGTCIFDDKIYIGQRGNGLLTRFNNLDDLTDYDQITVPNCLGIETMCVNTDTGKIYAIANGIAPLYEAILIEIDTSNLTFTYSTVYSFGTDMGTAPGIDTDNEYIYAISQITPSSIFYKISLTTFTLTNSATITGLKLGHACRVYKYTDRTEIYVSSGGLSGPYYFAKIHGTTLAYTKVEILGAATDDMAFKYIDNDGGECYLGIESGYSMYKFDTKTMTYTKFYGLPTFATVIYNNDLYSLCPSGFIIKYTNCNTLDFEIFKTNDIPNELFMSSTGRLFYSHWDISSKIVEFTLSHSIDYGSYPQYNFVTGVNSRVTEGIANFVSGYNNLVTGSNNVALGENLEILNSKGAVLIGSGLFLEDSEDDILNGLQNIIIGGIVYIKGTSSYAFGGKVGIGIDAPEEVFHLVGNARFDEKIIATALVEYADNAAALLGGLEVGAFFRTGDTLKQVISGTLIVNYADFSADTPLPKRLIHDAFLAEMYTYENTNLTTIGTQNVYHAIAGSGVIAGLLNGFTFVAGKQGTIASVANYNGTVAGTILITDVAHGLLTGDIITIHVTTNYNGTYSITKVTDDTFYVTKAYVASETGEWAAGCYLLASIGSDGTYKASFSVTAFAATANSIFKFELNKNVSALDNIVVSRKFATTDYTPMSCNGLVSIVAGDRIWLSTRNETNTADITIRNGNINLTRT